MKRIRQIAVLAVVLVCCSAGAPATVRAATSKLFPPTKGHAGCLRLAQVTAVASRAEILSTGKHYRYLIDSGIPDSLLTDGRLAAGRTYCCGGPNEEGMSIWFFVPPDLALELGDVVEVRMGREPKKREAGSVNTATRVRERSGTAEPHCRWAPPNERLWGRILYCDWMESEGWKKTHGLNNTWLKPPGDGEPTP